MTRALPLLSVALAFVVACGGAATQEPAQYGDAHEGPVREPFALTLIDAQGETFDVKDLQGKARLLFLFATFDLTSQAAIEPLRAFASQHPELAVIGIALQPDPSALLEIFARTLSVEFPLAYDPENRLLQGLTDLGRVEGVPTYVLIDREGFIERHVTGAMNAEAIAVWAGYDD